MTGTEDAIEIRWHRTPIDRDTMRELTRRTDWQGLLQTVPFLLLLCASGAAAFLAWGRLPWWAALAITFCHGTFFAFLHNGFHELVHGTVFKSKKLNIVFLYIFSFLSWNSHVGFRASHARHHLSTLHPPYDLEVVLPIQLKPTGFLLSAVVDLIGVYGLLRDTVPLAFGVIHGQWQTKLFPESNPAARKALVRWARITLLGHVAIIAVSALTGMWQIALVVSGARFYGGWLQWICNNTQHIGLQDNVEDYRLCCRTVRLNPFVQFLYFHMNYHTEHHMYASVPCYKLGRLHRAIAYEMPRVRWLIPAWMEIIGILRRQKKEPAYQYVMPLPTAPGHGTPWHLAGT